MTLSQFGVSKRRAARRQDRRARVAIAALGCHGVTIELDEVARSGWRTDRGLMAAAIRSVGCRIRRRLARS